MHLLFLMSVIIATSQLSQPKEKPPKPPGVDDPILERNFQFIGSWKGPKGGGTVILISPSWILTAGHVAKNKAEDPNLRIKIEFDNGSKAACTEAFLAPNGDLALAHISPSISTVKPARLLDHSFTPEDGTIDFTLAGHSGGLHIHPGRHGSAVSELRFRHHSTKEDPTPGRSGDSGGAWAVESSTDKLPIVFTVIHGGGVGVQPAANRDWIDKLMKPTGESAQWTDWKKQSPSNP